MDRAQKAREIIANIRYVTIATASKNGMPWNTPVFSAFDETYNFYWTSWHGTQHSQNIVENENIFIAVYDSTVPEGAGEGVYIKAKAYELADQGEITRAASYLYGRKNKAPRAASEFVGESPRRMYKAVVEKCWVNLDVDVKGSFIDTRREVLLI